MKSVVSIAGLLIALGGGFFIYHTYLTRSGMAEMPPQERIDTTDIRANLIVIGKAEQQYVVAHGAYGTLDELRTEGPAAYLGTDQRGYSFTVETDGSRSFTVTATPTDPSKAGFPTLVINETMQVAAK
jgi:hypothetical protein